MSEKIVRITTLTPLERVELAEAMMLRGVSYEDAEIIIRHFEMRMEHLAELFKKKEKD